MSNSRKHTHIGHCQACAKTHAVSITSGAIAKHGYTTRFGFFMGTCGGSDHLPLEVSREFADGMIITLGDYAKNEDARAKQLRAGKLTVAKITTDDYERRDGKWVRDRLGQRVKVVISWEDATAEQRVDAVARAAMVAGSNAQGARAHAAYLVKFIPTIFGKPLISVAPVDAVADAPLAVGDVVRVWGKTGFDAECIALRYAVCHGQGPSLNGHSVMHAVFRRPTGGEVAIPLRKIRRASIVKRAAITA